MCALIHPLYLNQSVWSSGTKDFTARLEFCLEDPTGVKRQLTRLKDVTEISYQK